MMWNVFFQIQFTVGLRSCLSFSINKNYTSLLTIFSSAIETLSFSSIDYLRWVRKLPLACPDPSHPGVGQVGPSALNAFQENGDPFSKLSFCRLAANGHPYALRWVAYFPLMWPRLSHPGTGHLWDKQKWTQTDGYDRWCTNTFGKCKTDYKSNTHITFLYTLIIFSTLSRVVFL